MNFISFCCVFLMIKGLCLAKEITSHKPEQGKFNLNLTDFNRNDFAQIFKTLYNESTIAISYNSTNKECKSTEVMLLNITIIGTSCKGEFRNDVTKLNSCIYSLDSCTSIHPAVSLRESIHIKCQSSGQIEFKNSWKELAKPKSSKPENKSESLPTLPKPYHKAKRLAKAPPDKNTSTVSPTIVDMKASTNSLIPAAPTFKKKVSFMGQYVIVATLHEVGVKSKKNVLIELDIEMKSPKGYLSADEYPLLTFYLIMTIVYVFYALAWIIMTLCNCSDLLRVQYWIGVVILLGLMEKAVYFSEYYKVNDIGLSNSQMEKFAGFVACLKRAVSRMLVIIVSLGFGVVKPRLGTNLYKVLGIGAIYFIVALLIQMFEIDVYFNSYSKEGFLVMNLPLVVIDIVIGWWIFKSLLQTMRTLRLRRNTTKLSLYRHFANTIFFCALVSLAMIIYIFYYHQLGCSEDFANNWFETACWPLLFSVILMVIMVLWRPSANNKRYAYSPMIDGDDSENEDAEEPMLGSGATEGMSTRGSNKHENVKFDIDMTEESLKWVDENIPPSVADKALPVLMDPDEIKKATKYEMSKMD